MTSATVLLILLFEFSRKVLWPMWKDARAVNGYKDLKGRLLMIGVGVQIAFTLIVIGAYMRAFRIGGEPTLEVLPIVLGILVVYYLLIWRPFNAIYERYR